MSVNNINTIHAEIDVNGQPVSNSNPLPVASSSVGPTGLTAPTSATELGAIDALGNLQALTVDPSGKLLVDITGSSTVTGTVNSNLLGLNAFQTSQYTVGVTAIQLTPTPLTNRSSMSFKAITTTASDYVYIGNSSAVTSSTGYIMLNGDSLQLDLTPAQVVYAIGSSAGQKVYVMEIGD